MRPAPCSSSATRSRLSLPPRADRAGRSRSGLPGCAGRDPGRPDPVRRQSGQRHRHAGQHPGRHPANADQGRAQPAGLGRDARRPYLVRRRFRLRGRARRVTPIDVATGKPGGLIPAASSGAALAVTPDGRTVYVAARAGTVTPVDVATGQPGRPISVPEPSALAVTPDGRTLYVADNNDQNVLPIDIATRIPGRPIPVGRYLMALAVTPDGRTLYTADGDDNTVAVLSLR